MKAPKRPTSGRSTASGLSSCLRDFRGTLERAEAEARRGGSEEERRAAENRLVQESLARFVQKLSGVGRERPFDAHFPSG